MSADGIETFWCLDFEKIEEKSFACLHEITYRNSNPFNKNCHVSRGSKAKISPLNPPPMSIQSMVDIGENRPIQRRELWGVFQRTFLNYSIGYKFTGTGKTVTITFAQQQALQNFEYHQHTCKILYWLSKILHSRETNPLTTIERRLRFLLKFTTLRRRLVCRKKDYHPPQILAVNTL